MFLSVGLLNRPYSDFFNLGIFIFGGGTVEKCPTFFVFYFADLFFAGANAKSGSDTFFLLHCPRFLEFHAFESAQDFSN